jgi:hypothetical protein
VTLTDPKGRVHQTKVQVRPDLETVVVFNRSSARSAENAEEFALVTGKTLMYIGVGIFYLFYAWCEECLDDPLDLDDDDAVDVRLSVCSTCGKAGCSHKREEPRQPPPKVGDILKPEKKP